MAKRKGSDSQPSAEVEQAEVLINDKQLVKLLKEGESISSQVGAITGALREKIGYAKEKANLHTGAFSMVRRLWKKKKSPEKLAEEYRTFLAYMEKSGLNEIINGVSRLPMGDEEADADGDVGGKPAKVSSLAERRAARDQETETEAEATA